MDNMDDSESNAKISDSAYSISCSNSQSRRSHSSKSTHSGSHSSGSSGYGGKPSTSGSSNTLSQPSKKDKESQKKKQSQTEVNAEVVTETEEPCGPPEPVLDVAVPPVEPENVVETSSPEIQQVVDMDLSTSAPDSCKEEISTACTAFKPMQPSGPTNYITSKPTSCPTEGFSCVISMHNGVVMYTTTSITIALGFPKDLWIGRSFIDFIHPKDRNTFASQITNGLAGPKVGNGTEHKASQIDSTMVCRIRRYRSLTGGFAVKERSVTFLPFMLKLCFKNITEDDAKVTYLVISASPFYSAFKVPNEVMQSAKPFVIRHSAQGNLEYIDQESVPYLGYLPQDIQNMDALQLYHDDDLPYLREIYEKVVREGTVPRSNQYRMKAQNGDYLKMQTEWSSFTNPWSMKLEFVIGKHFIIEGPTNPDVFQSPELMKAPTYNRISEESRNKAQGLRDSIVKILNEVLTKPAEQAKLSITKRCQDLATIMENLIADQPKPNEDLKLEIQDPDHSYYELDSVMLGGISPHHEYNDSKSSTETPLSYNQLNYNENLQRYFASHIPEADEYNSYNDVCVHKSQAHTTNTTVPPSMGQDSGESIEMSSCESLKMEPLNSPHSRSGDYVRNQVRLTESLLSRHNSDMEKELIKMRRESRAITKSDRERACNESRKKKKEHLARCNATYQPTLAVPAPEFLTPLEPHGTKRSKPVDSENGRSCPQRKSRRRRTSSPPLETHPTSSHTTTNLSTKLSTTAANTNTFIMGVPMPSHVPLMSSSMPAVHVPGVIPMHYAPTLGQATASTSQTATHTPSQPSTSNNTCQFPSAMPYMMYGHRVYGQPFMYSPVNAQVTYPTHQGGSPTKQYGEFQKPLPLAMYYRESPRPFQPNSHCGESLNTYLLASKNYEEACKTVQPLRPKRPGDWKANLKEEALTRTAEIDNFHGRTCTNALNRSAEATVDKFSSTSNLVKSLKSSESTLDKTDGESSYSSFYSSFFKTDSGSAEESGDQNKSGSTKNDANQLAKNEVEKPLRKTTQPAWMEHVNVTPELIYKYQVCAKSLEEVLAADKEKMTTIQQPELVNAQLEQLHLDLQLEGVAARLTLEEGITSSGSSGEESNPPAAASKIRHRKQEHSRLAMIYEEDAPMPSPQVTDVEPIPTS